MAKDIHGVYFIYFQVKLNLTLGVGVGVGGGLEMELLEKVVFENPHEIIQVERRRKFSNLVFSIHCGFAIKE